MGEVYVSLIAFLVSGAVIVVACHIGISIEHHKTTFERWTTQAQTRIRGGVGITASMPTETIVSSVLKTQRWPIRRNEFRGFNSPPGRF
jgi:hypothetical protein